MCEFDQQEIEKRFNEEQNISEEIKKMNVELKEEGSKLIITPKESMDSKTSPELEKIILQKMGDNITDLEFIMDGVDYISSAGIRTLLTLRKKIGGQKITLININNSVKEVLKLSALLDYFNIC